MMYLFNSYLWVSIILSFMMFTLIFYIFKNRTVFGAYYFLLTVVLVEIWVTAQGLEMAAMTLPLKIIWANIQYIPSSLVAVSFFMLIQKLIGYDRTRLKGGWFLLLFVIPAICNILLWVPELRFLMRNHEVLDMSGLFPTVSKSYGPVFWILAVYAVAVNAITFVKLVRKLKDKTSVYRKQQILLIVALLFPMISNLLQVTRLNPFRVDLTPIFFGLSAIIVYLGIFKYGLFDAIPIAYSIIIREMRTGMIILDNEDRILDLNPAAKKMLNIVSENPVGHPLNNELTGVGDMAALSAEGAGAVREMSLTIDDMLHSFEISVTEIHKSKKETIGKLLQIYDITERKRAESAVQYAAQHDSLTGLTSRSQFQILYEKALESAGSGATLLTTAFLDLDDFKFINDTYGHDIGDGVLCEVADRLKAALRESDIICRIGGDEFVIVLPYLGSLDSIEEVARKILDVFKNPFHSGDLSLQIGASVGFSVYPKNGHTADILLKKADQAMYHAKTKEMDRYHVYKE